MVSIPEDQTQEVTWQNMIPLEHWDIYKCVLQRACEAGVSFALGGGLALGAYTGRLRRSKDLDIYIVPNDREFLIRTMSDCGLIDYYETTPYDRAWIYRGHRNGVIVDAIWSMANKRAAVDKRWITTGPQVEMFGETFRVVPPEELLWSKLYVLQRDRCDWPDILNLIYATGPTLDWEHLLSRVGEDTPLLKGVLSVFSWVSPERARLLPKSIWKTFGLQVPVEVRSSAGSLSREDLLDSRPWLLAKPQRAAAA